MQQQLLLNRGGESTSNQIWPEHGWFVPMHLTQAVTDTLATQTGIAPRLWDWDDE